MDQRKTENLKIPLPMPNGDNNQDYFTDVFSTIDRNAANEEDLKKLREEVESSLQAKNVKISDKELNFQSGDVEGALTELANENKKQSQILVDGLKAENINTTQSYQGSSKDIESALSSISKEVDRHKYANGIRIRDARNNFQSTEVEGALTELATKQKAHSQRTDNPHGVTKAQVGLSNVDNIKQATKTEHNALKSRVDNLHAKDIKVTSTNLKSTSVDKALDELFTYADDVHARWASSIGEPLSKVDTAEVKEKKTKDLVNKVIKTAKHYVEYPDNIKSLQDIDEEINNRYRVFWESVGQEERYLFKMDFGRKVRIKIKELHQIIGFYVLIKEQSGNHSNLFYMGGNHYVPISSRGVLSYGSVSVNRVTNEVTIETDTIHYPDGYSLVVVLYRKKMDDIDLISHEEFM